MVNVIVRDIGDLTHAIDKLIEEAKEEALSEVVGDMEVQIEELETTISELRETIADLRSELDDKDTEINNLHKELMGDD